MQTTNESTRPLDAPQSFLSGSPLIRIDRSFSVPVDQLFSAFSTPDALKAWWWPKDLYADRIDLDFREGGHFFINMKGSAKTGGMTGEFEVIRENEQIVMSDQFADENGRPISAKEAEMPGVWPEQIHIQLDFESVSANSSGLHLSQDGVPVEMHEDCIQGWSQSFDKLEDYLTSRSYQ